MSKVPFIKPIRPAAAAGQHSVNQSKKKGMQIVFHARDNPVVKNGLMISSPPGDPHRRKEDAGKAEQAKPPAPPPKRGPPGPKG